MKPEIIIPKRYEKPAGPYSPAVKKGNMVFVGGQVGLTEKRELVGRGDIKTQTRQALENIRACLEEAGAKMEDVVFVQVFLPDVSNYQDMNKIYREYFPKNFPARATVITGLVAEEFLVEIMAIAITG